MTNKWQSQDLNPDPWQRGFQACTHPRGPRLPLHGGYGDGRLDGGVERGTWGMVGGVTLGCAGGAGREEVHSGQVEWVGPVGWAVGHGGHGLASAQALGGPEVGCGQFAGRSQTMTEFIRTTPLLRRRPRTRTRLSTAGPRSSLGLCFNKAPLTTCLALLPCTRQPSGTILGRAASSRYFCSHRFYSQRLFGTRF